MLEFQDFEISQNNVFQIIRDVGRFGACYALAIVETWSFTPMTVFKKLANFDEILKFLNVFGLIETLVNF